MHPTSRSRFTEDLGNCRGIFADAGFGITTEALHLGLPVVCRPVPNHLEQQTNAVWRGLIAARLRLGKNMTGKRTMSATNVNMAEVWRIHDDLAEAYVPQQYPGRLIHFRPARDYKCHLGTELTARNGVEYHRLRAYPARVMVSPFVAELAAKLKDAIADGLHASADVERRMPVESI